MSRPQARALSIIERLAEMIRLHAAEHPDLWLAIPATIVTEPSASVDTLPRPIVEIEVTGSEPADGGSIDLEGDRISLTLWLWSEDPESPQRALLELVADVRRAVIGNRQMEDSAGVPFLACGQLIDKGYTVATDFDEGGAGRGLAEYRLDAEYQWTPATA
jgi:hypothetical protein